MRTGSLPLLAVEPGIQELREEAGGGHGITGPFPTPPTLYVPVAIYEAVLSHSVLNHYVYRALTMC